MEGFIFNIGAFSYNFKTDARLEGSVFFPAVEDSYFQGVSFVAHFLNSDTFQGIAFLNMIYNQMFGFISATVSGVFFPVVNHPMQAGKVGILIVFEMGIVP